MDKPCPPGAAILSDLIRSDQVERLLQSHPLFALWYRTVGAKHH